MKSRKFLVYLLSGTLFYFSGCASMNKTKKGAIIGTVGGAAMGAVVGKAAGNPALGAVIGAAVGGATGAVIGRKMDKQAEEMKKTVPNAKIERVGEGIVVEFSDKILFDFNKSDLTSKSAQSLNALTEVLKKYPDTNIEVQGHTDSQGADDYNQGLSERRASSVSGYLSKKGISSARITTKGLGEKYPSYSNETTDGRAQNRRVNFLISANEKMKAEAKRESGQ